MGIPLTDGRDWYTIVGMPIQGPHCPDCGQRGAMTRVPMERAYVRREGNNKNRLWLAVGWFCRQCGLLVVEPGQVRMTIP